MSKYPIGKEYFPYSYFTPPIRNGRLLGKVGALMGPPAWLWRDHEVRAEKTYIKSFDGSEIELIVLDPYGIDEPSACLVYYHGGGFIFGAAGVQYKNARHYALETPCKVVFVEYRLAPKYPHPTPSEDCYAALRWTFDNAEGLNIDRNRIAVGGDSAGGALAAAVCQMARDRGTDIPLFQLLIYPVTDRRMITESCHEFTDTPMWNSKLSAKMWQAYIQGYTENISYASPMEAASFCNLPSAYVETAEFDCLRDEGLAYGEALRAAGVEVTVNETKGTIHGYDIAGKAQTTRDSLQRRVDYMQSHFFGKN